MPLRNEVRLTGNPPPARLGMGKQCRRIIRSRVRLRVSGRILQRRSGRRSGIRITALAKCDTRRAQAHEQRTKAQANDLDAKSAHSLKLFAPGFEPTSVLKHSKTRDRPEPHEKTVMIAIGVSPVFSPTNRRIGQKNSFMATCEIRGAAAFTTWPKVASLMFPSTDPLPSNWA